MQRGPIVLTVVLAALLLIAVVLYWWAPPNATETSLALDLSVENQAIAFVQTECELIGGDNPIIQACKDNAARLVAEDFAAARECEKFANRGNPECQPGFNALTP